MPLVPNFEPKYAHAFYSIHLSMYCAVALHCTACAEEGHSSMFVHYHSTVESALSTGEVVHGLCLTLDEHHSKTQLWNVT